MVKEHDLSTRYRAIGMLEAGMTVVDVSKTLGISEKTIRIWRTRHNDGEELTNRPGRGRKSGISRVAKIVISKSLTKRGHSTRSLSKQLTAAGHKMSHTTVHKYLRQSLSAQPFKPTRTPKLTPSQIKKRMEWCKEKKNWTIADWRRVIFSDESPFELFHPPNVQNDRIWARNKDEVEPVPSVKFPTKIMVWGAMSFRALTELHIVPEKMTVTAQYYVSEILEKSLLPALRRTRETGTILEKKILPDRSECIFMQDGAPSHTATKTQEWLKSHVASFWTKAQWPGNSPDLNPIENL